jgi:exonuclease SbcC
VIPLQLTLKNFLSYREASLDFRGLHTACICGANGAGKSSLLEAITWVIWGQSRASSEDDVIYSGTEDVRVDFEFIGDGQRYRIIRSRQRGKGGSLDFQVVSSSGFRSLNGKGIRATQEHIITALKLDYDTFINSAYLRQGRANEFMQRRPNERKQILADLLKLDQYEQLAIQAKDLSKQYKGQLEQLEEQKKRQAEKLEQQDLIISQTNTVDAEIQELRQQQKQAQEQLKELQTLEHQRQTWQQQLTLQQNQEQQINQNYNHFHQEQIEIQKQLNDLQTIIAQETEITAGYQRYLNLHQEEETLSVKSQTYQELQQQKQHREQEQLKYINNLKLSLQKNQTCLENLEQQEQEIKQTLKQSSEVEKGLEKLRDCRQKLAELDDLQHQVSPLLKRKAKLETDIEGSKARLAAELEQIRAEEARLSDKMRQIPQVRAQIIQIDAQIDTLEKQKIYRERVYEKGTERKSIQSQLIQNQQQYEKHLQELAEKLEKLLIPEAICPLCEQELDEHHRHHVIDKTRNQQQEIQEQIWQLKTQMAVCEQELQNLRAEYKQLGEEITTLSSLQQNYGQLEAQLEASGETKLQLTQIQIDITNLEQSMVNGNAAPELHQELQAITEQLNTLKYDEKTHALIRAEETRWRWAEIQQVKIEQAKRRQEGINQEKPKLSANIARLQLEIAQLSQSSDLQQQIQQIEQQLQALGYDATYHQNLRVTLRQEQSWELSYQNLQQTQNKYPQIAEKNKIIEERLQITIHQKTTIKEQIKTIQEQIKNMTDYSESIQKIEQDIQNRRQKLDNLLAQKGSLEQNLKQIEALQEEYKNTMEKIKDTKKKCRVYNELNKAFGKNGIQALMIENILPQLEAETNQILSRLTGNQLHIQFLTQKAGKSSSSRSKTSKLIDTLDILISDAKGRRSYETYSGGESFRINFSIRLALARLLAQRAGTALQMLIVDEGFGTQDADGCERLIAAINAISADFSCILTVTHMPQFKEAFQHRIEVIKTNQGSQLMLSN